MDKWGIGINSMPCLLACIICLLSYFISLHSNWPRCWRMNEILFHCQSLDEENGRYDRINPWRISVVPWRKCMNVSNANSQNASDVQSLLKSNVLLFIWCCRSGRNNDGNQIMMTEKLIKFILNHIQNGSSVQVVQLHLNLILITPNNNCIAYKTHTSLKM